MAQKILIIRFSSFGDICQCAGVLKPLKKRFPGSEIHWLAHKQFGPLLALNPEINKVWEFDRSLGFRGLIQTIRELKNEGYDYIYDAHQSLRTRLMNFALVYFPKLFGRAPLFAQRKKDRWKRFLLFNFRVNLFPWPFKGRKSYMAPLEKWGVYENEITPRQWSFPEGMDTKIKKSLEWEEGSFICLAPSAAWPMKRWPLSHWKGLVDQSPELKFIVLGGKGDDFCQELEEEFPDRVQNLAGNLSLEESSWVVSKSSALVSADTGILHVADILGIPSLSLIGPTAFGFTSGPWVKTLEVPLNCRPCTKDGRGKCSQDVYQKCMVEISSDRVRSELVSLVSDLS